VRRLVSRIAFFCVALAVGVSALPSAGLAELAVAKTQLVAFAASPFPYRGMIPGQGKPFLDVVDGEHRGHTSPRGGIYWEDRTYSDRRVLLHIPKGFDLRRPAVMVVFFHGNLARLERDVRDRQQVPGQVAGSGLNAVLVAPQFAVDALDSSAGRFWEPGAFAQFLDEAADRLAQLVGSSEARSTFADLPIVLVAYSGGYQPAAYALDLGGSTERIAGVVLLDALYGEEEKFAEWIVKHQQSGFFLSAYSNSSREANATLKRLLSARGVGIQDGFPPRLAAGTVAFVSAGALPHNDFVTRAWINDPLKAVLARTVGYSRVKSRER
jgi:hypothetical protein